MTWDKDAVVSAAAQAAGGALSPDPSPHHWTWLALTLGDPSPLAVIVASVTDEVRVLHAPEDRGAHLGVRCSSCCDGYGVPMGYPCPTARLLDEIDASAGVQR